MQNAARVSICGIRYEDLTRDPEAVLNLVFAFLGEEFDPALVTDAERRRSVLTATVVPWQAKILEPIRPPEEGGWRKRMNWHQRARVAAIVGDMLPGLGYLPPRRSTVRVGSALNAALLPRDLMRRRRVVAAMKRMRTPEERYTTTSRNWRTVHEQTTVEDARATGRRIDPAETIGVWLG